jgi:hypothetical protein
MENPYTICIVCGAVEDEGFTAEWDLDIDGAQCPACLMADPDND